MLNHALALMSLLVCLCAGEAQTLTPHQDIFRVAIPEVLPDHPRVFCTRADIDRIQRDLAQGDAYTVECVKGIRAAAEAALSGPRSEARPEAGDFSRAAALAQSWALTGERDHGVAARDILLWAADVCPTLKTTGAAGRFTDSTLIEGPLAVSAAMAWDLIAGADFVSDEQAAHIERDLLRVLAWECGHRCHHRDSSNWRSWALTIVASCGFAIGDRDLIEEAVNGVWDDARNCYLYGAVQQLTHSIFSDGIHWERSIGYTYYTGGALMYVMVAAQNSGIDLWHAKLPGLLGPFVGSAPHEEYGPPGDRSIKSFFDAPFYYAFTGGALSEVGDSGTRALSYHPMYELGWRQYKDPKYAWLINRERAGRGDSPQGWQVWKAAGTPEGSTVTQAGRDGSTGFRMKTGASDRIGLVQDVAFPSDAALTVSGWVKAIGMAGGGAHIRCNAGNDAWFTDRVRATGDWVRVSCTIPAAEGPSRTRSVRLHVFLEGGAGEVVWDDICAAVGEGPNRLVNPSFETAHSDGRKLDFWSLIHSPAQVPEGRYDLSEDAHIGLSGRNVGGCSLFPVGGFAVLRADAGAPDLPQVNLCFGPYGSGHDHPDRLHFDLFALGRVLCPDAGSWGYDNPMHLTWANQTIAHNTLTVDEVAQRPQGLSNSIWASEGGDLRVFGVLRLFQPGQYCKVVRATCDTAYDGVLMDRTLCVRDGYVLDVFRASSDRAHTYDLALHGPGVVDSEVPLEAHAGNPFTGRGYGHLTDLRMGAPQGQTFRAVFSEGPQKLLLLQATAPGGEIILAKDPKKNHDTSCCISRRGGSEALWVTVLEPFTSEPTVGGVSVTRDDGRVVVGVERNGATETFALEDALDGGVVWERGDVQEEARGIAE